MSLLLAAITPNLIGVCLATYDLRKVNLKKWDYGQSIIQITSILNQIFCVAGFSLLINAFPLSSAVGNTIFNLSGLLFVATFAIGGSTDIQVLDAFSNANGKVVFARSNVFKFFFYAPYMLCFLGHFFAFILLDLAQLIQYSNSLSLINEYLSIVITIEGIVLDTISFYAVFAFLNSKFAEKIAISSEKRRIRIEYFQSRLLSIAGLFLAYGLAGFYVFAVINGNKETMLVANCFGTAAASLRLFTLRLNIILKCRGPTTATTGVTVAHDKRNSYMINKQ